MWDYSRRYIHFLWPDIWLVSYYHFAADYTLMSLLVLLYIHIGFLTYKEK